jgi:chromosomal replication initiation ATPase DnaA
MSALKVPPLVETDEAARQDVLALAEPITAVTGVTVEEMLGRGRTPQVAIARHHLMAAMWRSGLSIAQVGAVLGRNHATVIYGLRRLVPPAAYQAEVLSRYTPSGRGSYRGQVPS